jgi:PhnB protein
MHTTAYLFYNGNCAEALAFYEKAIGATIDYTMTYGSSPAAEHVPAAMHGDTQLMASDGTAEESAKHAGFAICISVSSVAEAEKIFAALSDGATITMAMSETFFAERFGQFVDRFGVPWMVIFEKKPT